MLLQFSLLCGILVSSCGSDKSNSKTCTCPKTYKYAPTDKGSWMMCGKELKAMLPENTNCVDDSVYLCWELGGVAKLDETCDDGTIHGMTCDIPSGNQCDDEACCQRSSTWVATCDIGEDKRENPTMAKLYGASKEKYLEIRTKNYERCISFWIPYWKRRKTEVRAKAYKVKQN